MSFSPEAEKALQNLPGSYIRLAIKEVFDPDEYSFVLDTLSKIKLIEYISELDEESLDSKEPLIIEVAKKILIRVNSNLDQFGEEKEIRKKVLGSFFKVILKKFCETNPLHAPHLLNGLDRAFKDLVWVKQYNKEDFNKHFDLTYLIEKYPLPIEDPIDLSALEGASSDFNIVWEGTPEDLEILVESLCQEGIVRTAKEFKDFLTSVSQPKLVILGKAENRRTAIWLFSQLFEKGLISSTKDDTIWKCLGDLLIKTGRDGTICPLYSSLTKEISKINCDNGSFDPTKIKDKVSRFLKRDDGTAFIVSKKPPGGPK